MGRRNLNQLITCVNQLSISLTILIFIHLLVPAKQQQTDFYDVGSNIDCGLGRPTLRRSRILGGTPTYEFPWMVHLNTSYGDSIYNYSPSSFTCGGTLISDRHILTAAHCITDFNAYKLKITLGSPDLGNVNRLKVEWFSIFAQNYDDDYNLAIIKLKSPVTFSDSVRPICLPKYDDPDHVNDPVVISGWGKTSDGESSVGYLRKLKTTVISSDGFNGLCQQTAGYGPFDGSKIICSSASEGRYCSEDDGGPMNYYDASQNRWFMIGMATRGNRTDNICDYTNKRPNIYIRIRHQLDFIYSSMGYTPSVPGTNLPWSTNSPSASDITTRLFSSTTAITPSTTTFTPSTTTITPSTTTRTATAPNTMSCLGKLNGNYPNPESNCSKTFYMCSNGYTYLFECAQAETVYHPEIGSCDWTYNVAGCL